MNEKALITTKLKRVHGVQVLKIHDPLATSGSIQVWFGAGSALESYPEKGIAHFLEHMFFKGTAKFPGNTLTAELEKMGGEVNAFTSFDYTCYYVNAPQNGILKSLGMMIDMVSNPLFLEKDLKAEIDVVQEEFKRSLDSPSQYHFHQLQENFFAPPYHYPILGKPQDISSFTIEKIKNFRNKYYHSQNTLFVIAGNIQSISLKIDQSLKSQKIPKPNKQNVHIKKSVFTLKKMTNENSTIFHNKSVQQHNLQILIPGQSYDHPTAALEEILINYLSIGESSFLYKKFVQELELATSISGSTLYLKNGAAHFIRASIPPEKLVDFQKAWPKAWEEVSNKKLSELDIKKIQNQYYASKIFEKESVESYAFTLGHNYIFTGDLHGDEIFLTRVRDAKLSDVQNQLPLLTKKTWSFSLQSPMDFNEKLSKPFFQELKKYFYKPRTEIKTQKIKKTSMDRLELFQISNSCQVFYRYNPKTPTFSMHSLIDGGIISETKKTNGRYQMLARLLPNEHQKKNYETLQWDLEFLAASINGYIGKNTYGLSLHGLSEHQKSLNEDFFHCFFRSSISESQFEVQKNILLQTIKNSQEDPTKQCFKNFLNLFYDNHSYGLDTLGSAEFLENLKPASLIELHQNSIANGGLTFLFSGNVAPKDFEKNYLLRIQSEVNLVQVNKSNRNVNDSLFKTQFQKEYFFHHMDREQSHIFIGFEAFGANNPKNIFLSILNDFLSGQSSDLFRITRDELGLCYAVQSMINAGRNGGHWGVYIATSAGKELLAIESIKGILHKLATNGLSEKELKDTQSGLLGQQSLKLQTNDDFCNYYSYSTHFGLGLKYETDKLKQVKQTQLGEMNAFLKEFLLKKSLTVCVGRKNPWP